MENQSPKMKKQRSKILQFKDKLSSRTNKNLTKKMLSNKFENASVQTGSHTSSPEPKPFTILPIIERQRSADCLMGKECEPNRKLSTSPSLTSHHSKHSKHSKYNDVSDDLSNIKDHPGERNLSQA